jgi:hypothetical protein
VDLSVSVIVLCASPGNAEKTTRILATSPGLCLVAATSRLADVAPLCGMHPRAVLVVLPVSIPPTGSVNPELIAHISARECESLAGIVIVENTQDDGDDTLAELPALILRIGRESRKHRPPVAYYF